MKERIDMNKKSKTPQEKKRLSYQKDRRNSYGENDKASRKAIPLRKKKVNRQNRKIATQILNDARFFDDEQDLERIEGDAKGIREKVWQKGSDCSLAEHIATQEEKREERFGRKTKK